MLSPEGIPGEPSFVDLARSDDAALDAAIAGYQDAFTWWRRNDIVSIAAVQGHAIGAGFQLALACDLRIVADDVQFAMRETSLGLVPDLTGTHPSSASSATPARWRSARPGASSRPRSRWPSAWPTSPCPPPTSTERCRTSPRHCWPRPRDAVIETKALLRGAPGRTYDEQRGAERAAQARRLRDLAYLGE